MTDAELLQLACSAVPQAIWPSGKIVRGPGAEPQMAGTGSADDSRLLLDLEQLLGLKLPQEPATDSGSGDVAFQRDTAIGRRTTVVQIRGGSIARVIGQA